MTAAQMIRLASRGAMVVAIFAALSCRDWSQADEFVGRLRCEMTVVEVQALASSLGASRFGAEPRPTVLFGSHSAAEGRSVVHLGFVDGRLVWVRSSLQRGWTGMKEGVKRDLCTGSELGTLVISAGREWERATVSVDRTVVASLPSGPNVFLEIDVPGRSRTLTIHKQGLAPFARPLTFGEKAGVVRVDVP